MSKIIEVALAEVGTKESPMNSNNVKYNTWFYGRDVNDGDKPGSFYPWCGVFISWVYYMAGFPLGTIDYLRGFASCPFALSHITKWGKFIDWKDAQPGDIVFMDWQGDGKYDHVTLFLSHNEVASMFNSIEGNTSLGNDSNGGEVMKRQRRKSMGKVVRPFVIEK